MTPTGPERETLDRVIAAALDRFLPGSGPVFTAAVLRGVLRGLQRRQSPRTTPHGRDKGRLQACGALRHSGEQPRGEMPLDLLLRDTAQRGGLDEFRGGEAAAAELVQQLLARLVGGEEGEGEGRGQRGTSVATAGSVRVLPTPTPMPMPMRGPTYGHS